MQSRHRTSLIAALLQRRERPTHAGDRCPACGEPLTAADHAVHLRGAPYHAGCVLYHRRVRPGS